MAEMIGPYQVVERLGVGGMGEVYKAYDDRLERWVAIKKIRTDKETADEHRERFQREARATARLNHSSIVHVYDIFHDGDSDCIVMEYVEGRTLDKLVVEGSLNPLKVAKLGEEIASGLTEAHAKGILHRDLKVENIIVTPEGHAKILDFGLAKPILRGDLDSALTGKGQLVGTSRAMAPEYVSGEEVDRRSDLFSLGVLLYEAATGHSPFKSHNTLATLKQVMLYRQTPAHQLNPHVPTEMSDLIDRLLEKDPAKRPQDAEEVAQEFRLIVDTLSSETVPRPSSGVVLKADSSFLTPTATATSLDLWIPRRRWWLLAAVLAAVLGSAVLISRLSPAPPSEEPAAAAAIEETFHFGEKDLIVIGRFENKTGEQVLDDSVGYAFQVGLEQSRFARVLPQSIVDDALQRMEQDADTPLDRELGIEICRREGAKALVMGSIVKIGHAYTLTGHVIDPQTGITTFSKTAKAENQSAIVSALEQVTQAIRTHLGESLRAIEETQALEKVTTRNTEALQSYSLGVAKFSARDTREDLAAVQLLERALRLDPEFAMAHAKLGAYWIYYDVAKALEHLQEASRLSDRLTEKEKLYVEAWVARGQFQPMEELRIWSLFRDVYPNETYGHANVGLSTMFYKYAFEEAAQAFSDAIAVTRTNVPVLHTLYNGLGYCKLALGHVREALDAFERAGEGEAWQAKAKAHLVAQDYESARFEIESYLLDPLRSTQIQARLKLAQYHVDRGEFEEALRMSREAENLAHENGEDKHVLSSQLSASVILGQLARTDEYRTSLASATETALRLLSVEPVQLDLYVLPLVALVAKLNVRSSTLEDAERLLAEIKPIAERTGYPVLQSHVRMLEGEFLLMRGDEPARAIARFQDALANAQTFQAHESLSRVYHETGRIPDARAQYDWLLTHRGRAFVECDEAVCETLSIVDWVLALYHSGRLRQETGDLDEARSLYQRFLDHWPQADHLAVWRDAQDRLRTLQGDHSGDS